MANFGDFTHFGSSWLTQNLQDFNSTPATLVVRGVTVSDINVTVLSAYSDPVKGPELHADISVEQRQFVVRRSDLPDGVVSVGDTATLELGGHNITYRVVSGGDGNAYCDFDRFKELISFDAVQASSDADASDEGWI